MTADHDSHRRHDGLPPPMPTGAPGRGIKGEDPFDPPWEHDDGAPGLGMKGEDPFDPRTADDDAAG